jgi:hypothetical protein
MENLENNGRWFGLESNETVQLDTQGFLPLYRMLDWARLTVQYLCIADQCCCYKCMLYTSRRCTVRNLIVKARSDNLLLQRYILHRSKAWSEFVTTIGLNSSLAYSHNLL